ncbi:MAG: carboxypeptidase-like regulatory domain-containing protein [Planctomycetaceae bacterium]|jgi:5-hydroxyisourate hydrolase-like protein (transthyretin family)|nr:carboxypeptidase-like regulatory domain-containing protein [Planctomycetaceae bacterium]
MFKLFCSIILLCLWIPFLLGCNHSRRPAGLPVLHPCAITVTQNGEPVADVSVQLVSKEESVWSVTGTTDTSGNAVLVTFGQFRGAPVGDYKVVLSKRLMETNTSASEYVSDITQVYSLIDVKYTDSETSPLEMSVEKGRNAMSFEIGSPVRVLVDTIRPGT